MLYDSTEEPSVCNATPAIKTDITPHSTRSFTADAAMMLGWICSPLRNNRVRDLLHTVSYAD